MPVVAEAVPGLLHTSVFLFFIGLGDFVLNINTTVGLSTTIPIGIVGLLYIFTTFAPVIYPQSPYQNSFSGLIWYLAQKLGVRKYKDRGSNGMLKSASSNMVEGQMQLAMEETDERMGRDARAIRWLVGNQTADAEMESLAMTIPGSFNAEWGIQSWKKVSEIMEDENKNTGGSAPASGPLQDTNSHTDTAINRRSSFIIVRRLFGPVLRPIRIYTAGAPRTNTVPPLQVLHPPDAPIPGHSVTAPVQGDTVVRELSTRIADLLESCKNRGLFASDELWRRRSRACVETTASLVFCANAKFEWFGESHEKNCDVDSQNFGFWALVSISRSVFVKADTLYCITSKYFPSQAELAYTFFANGRGDSEVALLNSPARRLTQEAHADLIMKDPSCP